VNRMYTDKDFRNKVVANVTDVSVRSFWVDEYAKYTDKYAQEATPAIQNKIGQFAGNPLIRNIIGQPKSSFDLRDIMDNKKIMIVNLSKGRVGEGNARLLGSMLITKIYLAAMSRADEKALSLAKLPQFYLFVDEFQSFADKSFADILSEARKYKLNLTMAHQYIEQMEDEVREAVFGNVGTMIAFRVGAYDADVLEKEFAPVFVAEDLVNLGLRQIYLKLMIDAVTSQPFSASTMAPIEQPKVSYVDEIIENSRKTFAKSKIEVEKNIVDWHEEGKAVAPKSATARPYTPDKPVPAPVVKQEPKPIDIRGNRQERPVAQPIVQPKPQPVAPPVPHVSLKNLNEHNNNQRKPDAKHVSDLRDALKAVTAGSGIPPKAVMGSEKITNPKPQITNNTQIPNPRPEIKHGPSPEELKKILNV
ncbi:MAG: TraM recognition domain-containing protein, partial [Minisyncoccia bacterium]